MSLPTSNGARRTDRSPTSPLLHAAFALAALAVGAGVALSVGSTWIAPSEVWSGVIGRGDAAATIRVVRGPAVLLATLAGAWIATAGAAMQSVLRNPLADPYLLGVSGGAAIGAGALVALAPHAARWWMPAAAFGGAIGASALLLFLASRLPGGLRSRSATYSLLLTGVVFNAFAGAVILLLHVLLSPARSHELLFWLMGAIVPGRVSGGGWMACLGVGALGAALLCSRAPALNLLALGDDQAAALGADPARVRRDVLIGVSLSVAAAVAFTGLIGFVGLVVPHLVRLSVGADARRVLPLSLVGGALFLMLADALARGLFPVAQTSIPVGAVTALAGVPLFFAVLVRHLREGGA